MSKTLTSQTLPLFSIVNLDQLRQEQNLDKAFLTDFIVAWNQNIYLLMEQQVADAATEEEQAANKDWLNSPSLYTVIEIKVDWATQTVLSIQKFPLGSLKYQFHFIQPLGDNFLLLGARCAYRKTGPDKNAWIVSREGNILAKFCLGDGIQHCTVKTDGTIITSYFDEGVFGNYGWASSDSEQGYVEPIGKCGIIAWTPEGTPVWKNEKYLIIDCYAISLDEDENLWFYYYDDFDLVKTDFKEDLDFETPIAGSFGFAVLDAGESFIFQGGYQKQDKLYLLKRNGQCLAKKYELIPNCDGNKVKIKQCSLLKQNMLFLSDDETIYGCTWN